MLLWLLPIFGFGAAETSFKVDADGHQFLLDGKPFRYISGEIHYFRIHPSQWEDRLRRVRAMGLNAIQVYVPWNFHQPHDENSFLFTGSRDLAKFIQMAHNVGLYTLLRPGPYICAEWENGGLPWWLLKNKEIVLRSSDPRYISAVNKWFAKLMPVVKPLLRSNGGPILMLQVENEYGSYLSCDNIYLQWLRDSIWSYLGNDTQLYTTDPPEDIMCGVVDGVFPTVDFGPSKDLTNAFKVQRKYNNNTGPYVNSEFYPGWFSVWGDRKKPNLPSTQSILQNIQDMLELGASFSIYMIHGGTNFGFWNGAEYNGPLITSYDYFAPLTEAGDITPTYLGIRGYIKILKDWPNPPLAIPTNTAKMAYGQIQLTRAGSMFDLAQNCQSSASPMSFEDLNHGYGFVLYSTSISNCGKKLTAPKLFDHGYVYLDGQYIDHLDFLKEEVTLPSTCKQGSNLQILAENAGRINFETGNFLKGILWNVSVDGTVQPNWNNCPLGIGEELHLEQPLTNGDANSGTPGVYQGTFSVSSAADTFLDFSKWGKGLIFVNGFNLGRYWSIGPQLTLFVPSPLLVPGTNTITLIELEQQFFGSPSGSIASVDSPRWTWPM